jgi:transcriptional regulator with XRE-family HTH domain
MSIQALIRRRGLKQKWVAEQIGLDPGKLSIIVRGGRLLPIDKLTVLAQTLNVSTDDILKAARVYTPRRKPNNKKGARHAQSL